MKSVLNTHWKAWYWGWNSSTLTTWCKELTHWKRPWCWERLKAGGEGDDREWDGWMARRTWVWVDSGSWWRTGKPGVLQSMGSQRVGHNWATEHHHHRVRTRSQVAFSGKWGEQNLIDHCLNYLPPLICLILSHFTLFQPPPSKQPCQWVSKYLL